MATNESERSEEESEAKAEGSEERASASSGSSEDERASDESEESDESSGDDSEEASDDDESEESSDEEASDEESEETSDRGSDEEEETSDEEPASAEDGEERAEPGAKKGKKAKVGKDGLSAGARLAAAKAAKAARKAAKRGKLTKDADPLQRAKDSTLGQRASAVGSWAKENRNLVLGAVLLVLLGLAGWIGWSSYARSQSSAAAALLAEAVEITSATIRAEDDEPAPGEERDEDERTYPTEEARTRAALEAFRRVTASHPTSEAAAWARLGEGRMLAIQGEHSEAREAFQRAIAIGGEQPQIVFEALEGVGFAFEAEERWDDATSRYREMQGLANGAYAPIARYHLARMHLAKGERERALESFRTLVEELREEEGEDEEGERRTGPTHPFVLAQAEMRLRELDPSSAPSAPAFGAGAPGGEQPTQEQLQEMIRQMMQKAGGGAPPE